MNVVGLVLGNPCAFACASNGCVYAVDTQFWLAPPETVAVLFHDWVKALSGYDRVKLWTPRRIPPPDATLYRLAAEACGDRLVPVDPKSVRLASGLAHPTGREYVAMARELAGGRLVKNAEEAIAVLLAAGDEGDGA